MASIEGGNAVTQDRESEEAQTVGGDREAEAGNEPSIAERVSFWQEQDRINRELIPRVLKGHELLTRHIETHENGDQLARSRIQSLEEQLSSRRWEARLSYVAVALSVVALAVGIGTLL